MAEFPCLPLFTDAYLGDTTHLTTAEHGAYLLLLIAQWRSKDCTLPNDDKLLSRYTKMNRKEWGKARPILESFFRVNGTTWVQQRLQDEKRYVEEKRKGNIASGKVSALKRKERHSANVITNVPTEGVTNDQRTTNQPLTLTLNPIKDITTHSSTLRETPLFDELGAAWKRIWESYPRTRRGNQAKSKAAFLKALREKRATLEEIENGLARYRESDEVERGYAKGAEAWFNADGWANSYQPPRSDHQGQKKSYMDTMHDAAKAACEQIDRELDAGNQGNAELVNPAGNSGRIPPRIAHQPNRDDAEMAGDEDSGIQAPGDYWNSDD